jgi:hypothetical protein
MVRLKRRKAYRNEKKANVAMNDKTTYNFNSFYEDFQILLTNLQYSRPKKDTAHVIMVTSSTPNEGKTLLSSYLSLLLAEKDKKVLMIHADIRKGDTINLNVLTHMQARRLPRYIEQGYSFDSAMATLQSEISALLMLDTLHTEFNKLNLVTEQSESFYLLGATILSEVHSFSGDFDGLLALESLNDSTTSSFWYQAYNASTGRDCWKITENSRKFGYHYIITGAKKYLEQVWKTKFDLGECSVANKNEIKSAAFNSKYVMYCDSAKWQYPHDCSVLDKIVLDTTVGDTIAGHLTEAPYCKDTYYYWGTFQGTPQWLQADNIATGLKLACVKETRGLYGKSGKKCYYCDGSYWLEKDMTECDEHIVSAGQTN